MSLPASTWLWRFLDLYVKRGFIQKSGTSIEAHIVCYLRADCFLCSKIWSFWVFRILLHFLRLWAPCDNKPQDFKLKKNDILKLSKFASTVSTPHSPCTCGRLPTPTSLELPVPPWLIHRLTQGHHRDHTTARAAPEKSAEMGQPAWRKDPRMKSGSRGMRCCQRLPLWAQTRGFIPKSNTYFLLSKQILELKGFPS